MQHSSEFNVGWFRLQASPILQGEGGCEDVVLRLQRLGCNVCGFRRGVKLCTVYISMCMSSMRVLVWFITQAPTCGSSTQSKGESQKPKDFAFGQGYPLKPSNPESDEGLGAWGHKSLCVVENP